MTAKAIIASIVGGGVALSDENGGYQFIIAIRATTAGISRTQSESIARQIVAAFPSGIVVRNSG